jgi:Ca2+-binding RTX toxin-like protein
MLITTLSRFVRGLHKNQPRPSNSWRSRGGRNKTKSGNDVPAMIEALETKLCLSALSFVQDGLGAASSFLGGIESDVKNIDAQMADVPLIGDKVNSSLQTLAHDIDQVKLKIDDVAAHLSTNALENDIRTALFNALGPQGLNILGDSTFMGSTPTVIDLNDIFVKIVDNGDVVPSLEVNFNLHRDLIDDVLAQGDFNAGLDSLPFKVNVAGQGGVKINVGFDYQNFHFTFDEVHGLSFDDSVKDELTLYATAGLTDNAHLDVTVGFLKAKLTDGAMIDTDNDPDTPAEFEKTGLSLIEPIDINFGGIGIPFHPETPYLSADLRLHLDTGFSDPTAMGINHDFPGFATDFVLHRELGEAPTQPNSLVAQSDLSPHFMSVTFAQPAGSANALSPAQSPPAMGPIQASANAVQSDDASGNGPLKSLVNPADVADLVSAAFDNVQLKMGDFLSKLMRPICDFSQTINKPIKPLLDALREDIPLLSQDPILGDLLNDDGKNGVSFIDLATVVAKLNALPTTYDQILEAILFFDKLRNFIDSVDTDANINNLILDLGSHTLINKSGGKLDALATALTSAPTTTTSLVDGNLGFDDLSTYSFQNLKTYVHDKLTGFNVDPTIIDQLDKALAPVGNGVNYSYPVLEHPVDSIMQILIGRDADLFTMQGQAILPTSNVSIPLVSLPFGIQAEAYGSTDFLATFKLGVDSYGLRAAFADPNALPEELADSNYVGSSTEFKVDSTFGLKVGTSALLYSASVTGGVQANIDIKVPVPPVDADGDPSKVRLFSELGDCLMDASGGLSAFLSVQAGVGIGPLMITKNFDLAKLTIIDYSGCLPNPLHNDPPLLGTLDAQGNLTLLTGPLAWARNVEPAETKEIFHVSEIPNPHGGGPETIVSAFGRSQTFLGVKKIVADGGSDDDHIVIENSVHSDAILIGGDGNDTLEYLGTGNAVLRGGNGDDELRGGNGATNVLLGEAGNDTLIGGGLDGTTKNVFGLSATYNVTDDPGDDLMQGGLGLNEMHGGTGNDILEAGPLNDSLFGDAGNDTLQAGIGQSTLNGGIGDDSFVISTTSGSTQIVGDLGQDTTSIQGTDSVDTFVLSPSNLNLVVTQTTAGVPTTRTITMIAVENLMVDGGRSADNITVNYLGSSRLQNLGLDLEDLLAPDQQADHIVINGQTTADNVTIDGEQVDVKAPNNDVRILGGITTLTGLPTYKIDIANILDDVQFRMLAGNDLINVLGVTGPTIIDGGTGDDIFNVTTQNLLDFIGAVTLNSGLGNNQVNFATDPIATPQSATLTDKTFATHWFDPRSAAGTDQTINYLQTDGGNFSKGVSLTTNGIDDRVFVRSTLAGTTTAVNTGGGNDVIVVSSQAPNNLGQVNDIRGNLTIDAGSGLNDLQVSDFLGTTSQNVSVTNSAISGLAGPNNSIPIGFKSTGGQLSLELNGSNTAAAIENFLIQSPAAILTLYGNEGNEKFVVASLIMAANLYGGNGNDQFLVGLNNALTGIKAPLVVTGNAGQDSLILNDSALAAAGVYMIDTNSAQRGGTGQISFDHEMDVVSLNTGKGADNVQVVNSPAVPAFNLNTGNGNDRLTGPNGANDWLITQKNQGQLNNNLHFTNTEILRGGVGNDHYAVGVNGQLTGGIQDLGGTADTLDYSAWQNAVSVDLQFQTASGVNGVQGIENVIGGSGNDYLAGDANANQLTGGGGDDIILGRDVNDSLQGGNGRDLLIGGLGADALMGGPDNGEDLLIGGRTNFDNDFGSLNRIRTEWSRTNINSQTRIADLKAGVGPNHAVKLTTSTVLDDGISDSLFGQGGMDWFWAATSGPNADQLTDLVSTEQLN